MKILMKIIWNNEIEGLKLNYIIYNTVQNVDKMNQGSQK